MTDGIILSSAFVQAGLLAEFGPIPPSFLPLGNRRLYRQQVALMKSLCDNLYLSLPVDFEVPRKDVAALDELGVEVIRCNKSAPISEAILACLAEIGRPNGRLVLLYGDTLFDGLTEMPRDGYGAHAAIDDYKWEPALIEKPDDGKAKDGLVVSGIFSFSSTATLRKALTNCEHNFIEAMRRYNRTNRLEMVREGKWLDFGHTQTFYESCGFLTTQRSFNSLKITRKHVEKRSDDSTKMKAEAHWFESLPPMLRVYTPAYLGQTQNPTTSYKTENTYLSTLANLASFGNLSQNTWTSIFEACLEFLQETGKVASPADSTIDISEYYLPKTQERLKQFGDGFGFNCNAAITINGFQAPSALQMAKETADIIAIAPMRASTLIHGDFCFSNIFFNFRSRMIKVIDPRGLDPSGKVTIFGDPRYDVAKLAHSALGWYDSIISGDVVASQCGTDFLLEREMGVDQSWKTIEDAFSDAGLLMSDEDKRVNHSILVHLFLSMLPLHSDHPERQVAFLANAGRLYLELEQ